jgi:hypothetical protein
MTDISQLALAVVLRRVVERSPRAAHIWRELARRLDELADDPDDIDLDAIAADADFMMLVQELVRDLLPRLPEPAPTPSSQS